MLYFCRSRLTDVGVAHMRDLPGLRSLCLTDTQVTDAGMQQLERYFDHTPVAAGGPQWWGKKDPPR